MQHRASRHAAGGRHRRTTALHSHRAPREPIAEKSRYAMAAALVAGVSVAGVSATDSGGTPAKATARAHNTPLTSATANSFLTAATSTAATAATAGLPTAPAGAASSAGAASAGAASSSAGAAISSPGNADSPGTAPSSPENADSAGTVSGGNAESTGAGSSPGATTVLGLTGAQSTGPRSGVAGIVPIGGLKLGDEFVAQHRKQRPRPEPQWVNPMPAGVTTSCFGERWGRLHAGVDLAAPSGTPIVAAGAGIVVAAGPAEGYGNAVLVEHGNGYLTHYAHMSAITVQVGQRVVTGQQVGNEGSTGHSTGPHLHFEVHRGSYKNPIEPTAWMRGHGIEIPGCAAS